MARIALYGAGGAPYNHAAILAGAGHEVKFIFPADIVAGALSAFDGFVMPGGGYFAMKGQLDPLGVEGCRAIRQYVEAGGIYISSCAGSYDAAVVPAGFLNAVPQQAELQLVDARIWNDGTSTFGFIQSPGIGEIIARNVAPTHPVMAGMPSVFRITHYNGPFFVGGRALSQVAGVTDNFTAAEDFLGSSADELLIDEATAEGVSNIVADERGNGRVVLFGSHPEFGASLTMEDFGLPATMLLNAVNWQMQHTTTQTATGGGSSVVLTMDQPIAPEVVRCDLGCIVGLVHDIDAASSYLASRTDSPAWLEADQAMSMFGATGLEIWNDALKRIPEFAHEALERAVALPDAVLSFRPPEDVQVDGGFWGVVPLLEQTYNLLTQAAVSWDESYPAEDGYDHLIDNPYHLVAGSYLAAVGRASAAALLTRAFAEREVTVDN